MATLQLSIRGQTVSTDVLKEISDLDVQRILKYLKSTGYGRKTEMVTQSIPDEMWSPSGNQTEADRPLISATVENVVEATTEETVTNFSNYILEKLIIDTVEFEKLEAAAEARNKIAPIDIIKG